MRLRGLLLHLILTLLTTFTVLTAEAQPAGKGYRIGWLTASHSPAGARSVYAVEFTLALGKTGWVEDQHFTLDYRDAAGGRSLADLAAELVGRKVDVIVAQDEAAALAAKRATASLPIVFVQVNDPIGAGLVASLARPGGNVTGVASDFPELGSKLVELLKETVPGLARAALVWDPSDAGAAALRQQVERAAQALEITRQPLEVRQPADLDAARTGFRSRRPDGLIVLQSSLIDTAGVYWRLKQLVREHRLPAIIDFERHAWEDFLMAYGPSRLIAAQRAAHYARRILEGAKPSTLPVERPTQFDLVVNLRSAKALGLTVPQSVLARATAVLGKPE
jgi:putative ABC transport system substrate-binding protein